MLVANLLDQAELSQLIDAALSGRVALLPLEDAPLPLSPGYIELREPETAASLVLWAVPDGEPASGMYPIRLEPLDAAHADALRAFRRGEGPLPDQRPSTAPATEPHVDPLIGRALAGGKYEILTLLGSGGSGKVYKARHTALDKIIAIKILHASFHNDARFAARFHREALATSKLDHPNIMRVIDFGREEPDGLLYIAMEFLAGRDLQSVVDGEGHLPERRAIQIMLQVCAALTVAHEQGIVHRDMKPENIVVLASRNDEGLQVDLIKVCDFGIAKLEEPAGAAATLDKITAAGTVFGTPQYMSPEQARAQATDARSDIYSCGIILYELVTGRLPFVASSPLAVAMKHLTDVPEPPSRHNPDLNPRIDALILKALSKEPAHRQQTARELRAELRAILESRPLPTAPTISIEPARAADLQSMSASAIDLPAISAPAQTASATEGDALETISLDEFFLQSVTPGAAPSQPAPSEGGADLLEVDFGESPSQADLRITPSTMIPPGEARASALDDASAGFAELFVALNVAAAMPDGDEHEHDAALGRLCRAAEVSLRLRGQITIARRDHRQSLQLFVHTGTGELYQLPKVLPPLTCESHGIPFAELLIRRDLVALTLREGVKAEEVLELLRVLRGSAVVARSARRASALSQSDVLGRRRNLPWEIDVQASRFARSLLDVSSGGQLGSDELSAFASELAAEVVRTLRDAEAVRVLLLNADLITEVLGRSNVLEPLDIAAIIVAHAPQGFCVRLAGSLLDEIESTSAENNDPWSALALSTTIRKIIHGIGARLVEHINSESDQVLQMLRTRAVLARAEMPVDLQLWMQAADRADEIVQGATATVEALDRLDAVSYPGQIAVTARALQLLAVRGEVVALWTVLAGLRRHARGAGPGDAALASEAVRSLEDTEILRPVAEALLTGGGPQREAAQHILVGAGTAAAHALCQARADLAKLGKRDEGGRPRFVSVLREMGDRSIPALGEALSGFKPRGSPMDTQMAEDLLRSLPDVADDSLGRIVQVLLSHPTPSVRRLALSAFAGLMGPKAYGRLISSLEDSDDGVRIAAIAGLRRIGRIDREVVQWLDRLLESASTADELCATALAALVDVTDLARPLATNLLMRVLTPSSRSGVWRLVGGVSKSFDGPLVVEASCRALIAIGGQTGRGLVEARAAKAAGPLRERLRALLGE